MMILFQSRLIRVSLRLVFCLFILVTQNAFAQEAFDYTTYKDLHPNAHFIRLNQEVILNIGLEKGEFDITMENIEEDMYFYESAKGNAKQSLNFSSFIEIDKIEASSFVLKGDNYVEMKVTEFKESDELEESFYDDLKSINFIFPSLGKGSKTKLKYEQKIKNPRFLNSFYFGNYYPIERSTLTIICDKNINLRFLEKNMEGIPVKFSEKKSGKHIIYSWEVQKMDEYKYADNAPNHKNFLPHIIPIIVSYKQKGETKKVLGDVSDLYQWYYSLVKELNSDPPSSELIQIVENLTADEVSELEKVRSIYYWVQDNIKYIAFEYALGGFVPREANDVLQKKYGDCKDNSSLLFKMLEIAGIEGNLVWIGTRSIPYRYEDVPTPVVDNHMILHYEYQGKSYFLDGTGRYNPIELPTPFIQGKEALVSLGADSFVIKRVPIIEPAKNAHKEYITLDLEENNLIGKSSVSLSGYDKIELYYRLERKKNETQLTELYNSFLRMGNNSFQVIAFEETNKYSYDEDFVVDYNFKIPNYSKSLGDELYINLNLHKTESGLKSEEDREVPIENEFLYIKDYQYLFNVPEGYVVDYLPEDLSILSPYFDSEISYVLRGDQIVYKHNFKLKELVFDVDALKEINKLLKKVERHYKEVVVLKKS